MNIDQRFVHCKSGNKYAQLIELLDSTVDGMALVFVGRKNHVAYLERFLSEHEFSVTSLHGDKKQNERDHALSEFRSGRKTVLVATDVASRIFRLVLPFINFCTRRTRHPKHHARHQL